MCPKVVDKPARKAELLTAAMAVFGEVGYHRATMQEVAERAGVSKGSLYDYFASKEELLLCTAEWLSQTTMSALLPPLHRTGTPLSTRVATFMDSFLQRIAALQPVLFTVLQVWAEITPDGHSPLRALCTHLYKDFADQLESIFEEAILAGDAAPFATRPSALALMAVIDGVLLQSMIAPDEFKTQLVSRCIPQWCGTLIPQYGENS